MPTPQHILVIGGGIIGAACAYSLANAGNMPVAAGHNMKGLCMGAASGELVTPLLTGQKTMVDDGPFTVGAE